MAVALFAVQCMAAASYVLLYQRADGDTALHVQIARACIERGECTTAGPHAAALGLRHGAVWFRLLSHFLRSGGGIGSVQITVLVLLMISGAVSYLVLRRYLPARAALLAFLLYLPFTVTAATFTGLSNKNLLPLPLVLYYASAALCVEFGSAVAAVVASVFLALAISANITCGLMVPFHLGLAALCARRPVVAVTIATIAVAVVFSLESSDAALELTALLVRFRNVLGFLAAAAVLAGVGPLRRRLAAFPASARRLRARLGSLPPRFRMRVVMKTAVVYISATIWLGCVLARSAVPESHYLVPIVFPLVFLAADSAGQLSGRATIALWIVGLAALLSLPLAPLGFVLGEAGIVGLSALAVLGGVAWAMRRGGMLFGRDLFSPAPSALALVLGGLSLAASLPDTLFIPRSNRIWPAIASETLAHRLYESGFTYSELLASFQEHSFGQLSPIIAAMDPKLFAPPEPVVDTRWSLLALVVEPGTVPRTDGVLFAFPIHGLRWGMVVRAPSYLDRVHVQACYEGCGTPPVSLGCSERMPQRPTEIRGWGDPPEHEKSCGVSLMIPLHTSGSGVPHIVRVAEQWPLHLGIASVKGVDFEGQLPGPEVRLTGKADATGVMELKVSYGGLPSFGLEPQIIEVTAANEHLLDPARTTRTSLW